MILRQSAGMPFSTGKTTSSDTFPGKDYRTNYDLYPVATAYYAMSDISLEGKTFGYFQVKVKGPLNFSLTADNTDFKLTAKSGTNSAEKGIMILEKVSDSTWHFTFTMQNFNGGFDADITNLNQLFAKEYETIYYGDLYLM